ncbi:hypothetical protein MNV49_003163 [Pseudohyphozyma bogoriensis]|nr:hypothetical protein MNV49_003163 [Pseudohyphozyma bogoriensis]
MSAPKYSAEQLAYCQETIRPNLIMQNIAAGKRSFSAGMQSYYSPEVIHMMKLAGFESVHINLEHSAMSLQTLNDICSAALAHNITPIIVTPKNGNEYISRALDLGVQGVIVPRISTVADAEEMVKYCKYRPLGERPYMTQMQMQYQPMNFVATMETLNARTLCMAMIETKEGLENIEAIAKVPGVDVLFIGSFDLSDELGITGQFDSPILEAAFDRVTAAAKAASVDGRVVTVGAGGLNSRPDVLKKFSEKYDNLLTFMVARDRDLLFAGLKNHYKVISA